MRRGISKSNKNRNVNKNKQETKTQSKKMTRRTIYIKNRIEHFAAFLSHTLDGENISHLENDIFRRRPTAQLASQLHSDDLNVRAVQKERQKDQEIERNRKEEIQATNKKQTKRDYRF
jgi:hypothetical protein